MTREEAIKMLSILKAAYPNSYKVLTKDEANGIISIWSMQFIDMPFEVVLIAVNKLISTNTFPPSINEVKQKIQSLYWEAWEMLNAHKQATEGIKISNDPNEQPIYSGEKLDEKTLATVKEIVRVTDTMRTKERLEPSLNDLLTGYNIYLTDSKRDELKLK